jgi:hypothetical protein
MKTLTLSIIAIALLAIAGLYVAFQSQFALGSVAVSNEYNGVVYDSTRIGTSTIGRRGTTLGTIIVSSTSPVTTAGPVMAFYDTSSTTRPTTTMTAFAVMGSLGGVTPPANDYTFDVMASSGIMVWVDPTFKGIYNVTYR